MARAELPLLPWSVFFLSLHGTLVPVSLVHGTLVPEEWRSKWGLCRLFAHVGFKISTTCLCRHLRLCLDTPLGCKFPLLLIVDYCQWPLPPPPCCGKPLLGRRGMPGFSTSTGGEVWYSCHYWRSSMLRGASWVDASNGCHKHTPTKDPITSVSHSPVFSPVMATPLPVLHCDGLSRVRLFARTALGCLMRQLQESQQISLNPSLGTNQHKHSSEWSSDFPQPFY